MQIHFCNKELKWQFEVMVVLQNEHCLWTLQWQRKSWQKSLAKNLKQFSSLSVILIFSEFSIKLVWFLDDSQENSRRNQQMSWMQQIVM